MINRTESVWPSISPTDANGRTDDAAMGRTNGLTDTDGQPPAGAGSYTRNIYNNNFNICIHKARAAGGHGNVRNPLVRLVPQPVMADQPKDPDDLPDHEPTDEELWVEDVARQVEADARPLFAALWIWLLQQALEADENEEPRR